MYLSFWLKMSRNLKRERCGRQIAIPDLVPALLCGCADRMPFEIRTDRHRRCLIEKNEHLWRVSRLFIETADSKLDNRFDLFPVQPVEPFHDVVDTGSGLDVLKDRRWISLLTGYPF